jgi:Na+-translocating ferredoxin:NAD+ oxidoreductase subunit B
MELQADGPMFLGAGLLVTLAVLIGVLLTRAAARLPLDRDSDVERVNSLLPQIQCGQCGLPGCRPYAEALVQGTAEIDQCPPGGQATVQALAELLGHRPRQASTGMERPAPQVAVINEPACIGCVRCVEVCPVDAIVGAARFTHTVLAADCTGCELCIPACPVDCITLAPVSGAVGRVGTRS